MDGKRPENVGILAYDFYTPKTFVDQAELGKGKYTIGLGQLEMGFPHDREDIRSIALTVTKSLLEKNNVDPETIGRVEVGTETIIDKSKSVKSALMALFPHGDVLGVDCVNACYGGTAAFFNAVDWIESSAWNGKNALVIAGDIAIYAQGAARPTGGCGVLCMMIGPNAPIVVEPGLRGTHCENVYDFFKPNLSTQYPVVDGKLSLVCYIDALDKAYERYGLKYKEKSYTDMVKAEDELIKPFGDLKDPGAFLGDRAALSAITKAVKGNYDEKVEVGHTIAKRCGNIYCGSVYGCLLSAITNKEFKEGERILSFSYGSGLCSSFYSVLIKDVAGVKAIVEKADVIAKLDSREKVEPAKFVEMIESREKMYVKPFNPKYDTDVLRSGTYYLVETNDKYERIYARKE